jgi:hypothetical protein
VTRWGHTLCAALVALVPCRLEPQAADSKQEDIARFVARARTATERFKDISVAVSESYVKVGPDFPAMGVHWVNGELIMRAELDPARPAILTYATIGGQPTLTGAVYALALRPGEEPPEVFRGAHWHDHVGSVDEESLLFGHDRVSGSDDLRLVVMHAWLWLDNPAGMFATDNWALPFARIGATSAHATPAAGRALSLLSNGAGYYERLFASAGRLEPGEVASVARVLERHRAALSAWWTSRAPSDALSSSEIAELERAWLRVQSETVRAVRGPSARALARLFAHH